MPQIQQIPTLISSSHADLKSCAPNLSTTPPKNRHAENILRITFSIVEVHVIKRGGFLLPRGVYICTRLVYRWPVWHSCVMSRTTQSLTVCPGKL